MEEIAAALRLLADPTRLRLLRLVAREELNAGELTSILGLGQSAVSRQLSILRDAGLVGDRRAGRFVFFRLATDAAGTAGAGSWILDRLADAPDPDGDLARLAEVLRSRRERELGTAEGDGRAPFVPGRSWRAWARALSWLMPETPRVVDLACGDGALTLEIARFAGSVVGIDTNVALLARARDRAGSPDGSPDGATVRFVEGSVQDTGLASASFELAVLSQALHHMDDPVPALLEARRLVVPGGRVLVLDLLPHAEEWVRDRLGHRRLGMSVAQIGGAMETAGLTGVRLERMPARAGDPFKIVIAVGRRPTEDRP